MQHGKNTNYSKCDKEIAHREKTEQQIKYNMKKVQHKQAQHKKREEHEKSTINVSEIWKNP